MLNEDLVTLDWDVTPNEVEHDKLVIVLAVLAVEADRQEHDADRLLADRQEQDLDWVLADSHGQDLDCVLQDRLWELALRQLQDLLWLDGDELWLLSV